MWDHPTNHKGGSRGVSKVSKNWSDHLWLVFACISLIMSMLPYSYTFMHWKPVIKVYGTALESDHSIAKLAIIMTDIETLGVNIATSAHMHLCICTDRCYFP